MALNKPYHRLYRPLASDKDSWDYLQDQEYAIKPDHYTRSFIMIQNDIKKLFEYIEPSDTNLKTYSFEIYQLLLRIATEVEANFKAILRENKYTPTNWERLNTNDYLKINRSHKLSSYSAEFPIWTGEKKIFTPFELWKNNKKLLWYDAYNKCKHDRVKNLELANFENLLNAFCGLFILLSSQFGTCSYEPGVTMLCLGNDYYKGNFGIGDYLIIHFPKDWDDNDYYDFDWNILKEQKDRFNRYDYDVL